jgi:hypothetical protein
MALPIIHYSKQNKYFGKHICSVAKSEFLTAALLGLRSYGMWWGATMKECSTFFLDCLALRLYTMPIPWALNPLDLFPSTGDRRKAPDELGLRVTATLQHWIRVHLCCVQNRDSPESRGTQLYWFSLVLSYWEFQNECQPLTNSKEKRPSW